MAGIQIALVADVKSFLTGAKKAEDATEDISGALDDLAADAQRSGKEAGRSIATGVEAGTDDSTDSVQRLERTFRDLAQSVSKDTKRVGDDLGDNVRRGTKEAESGVEEFGSEAGATARETAASFDGSAESIAGAFQEVAANAFAGFGPAGAAAGLAVAAGLGIAISTLQDAADKANALTEDAAAFALSLRDTDDVADRVSLLRDRWDEVATKIADARSVWEVWQPRAVTNIERFAEAAKVGGFNVQGMFDAFDDPDPVTRLKHLNDVFADTQDRLADVTDEIRNYEFGSADQQAADAKATEALQHKRDALQGASDALKDEIDTSKAAADINEALALAAGQTVEQYNAATTASEAAAAASEQLAASYAAALEATADPVTTYEGILDRKNDAEREAAEATAAATEDTGDSWEDYVSGVSVSTDDLIAEWNRQADEAAAFEANLATIAANGGQALADELRAKGPEVAGAVADVIAKADPATQQAAIDAHARATGQGIGTGIAGGISDQQEVVQKSVDVLAGAITSPSSPVLVHVAADTTELDRELAKPRHVVVGVAPALGTRVV